MIRSGRQSGCDCTYELFADVVHDPHYAVLIPPVWIMDTLHFTFHDNNLASWNKLPAAIRCPQVRRDTGWDHVSVKSLRQAVDHFISLTSRQSRGRTRGQDEVSVEIYNERIGWCTEECAALCRDTQNVWTRFLGEFLGKTRVYDWYVQATPFVDPDTIPDGLGGDSKHGRVMTDEDDAPTGRHSGFDDSDDVRNGQASKKRPHSKILEARRR